VNVRCQVVLRRPRQAVRTAP